MFLVKANTPILAIKNKEQWFSNNFKSAITRRDNVFDIHELIIDPAGIAKHATFDSDYTIGGFYAKNGYYGFKSDKWTMLVKAEFVTYG